MGFIEPGDQFSPALLQQSGELDALEKWRTARFPLPVEWEDGTPSAEVLRLRSLCGAALFLFPTDWGSRPGYGPVMVIEKRRSADLSDFDDIDLHFLTRIAAEVKNPHVKARFSDIVFLLTAGRTRYEAADIAADAYLAIVNIPWHEGGEVVATRMLDICRRMGKAFAQRGKTLVAHLVDSVVRIGPGDPDGRSYELAHISDFLYKSRAADEKWEDISTAASNTAEAASAQGDLARAASYWGIAADWKLRGGDDPAAWEMRRMEAECFAEEATQSSKFDSGSMAAASTMQKALQTYRRIPRKWRVRMGCVDRVSEIIGQIEEWNGWSLEDMTVFESDSMDISELVESAEKAVRGRDLHSAMFAFVSLVPPTRLQTLRDVAADVLESSVSSRIASHQTTNKDGLVTLSLPAYDPSDPGSVHAHLHKEVMRVFSIAVGLNVKAFIVPAMLTFNEEHNLWEGDLLEVLRRSPLVPPGREHTLAKGLCSGFRGDFQSATQTLAPQVEHLLRFHLKNLGTVTIVRDDDGTDVEVGLSTLLDKPEAVVFFGGEDMLFEARALFTDRLGGNLRNDVAHGLLEDSDWVSSYTVFAWWWVFRLVLYPFLKNFHQHEAGGSRDEPQQ